MSVACPSGNNIPDGAASPTLVTYPAFTPVWSRHPRTLRPLTPKPRRPKHATLRSLWHTHAASLSLVIAHLFSWIILTVFCWSYGRQLCHCPALPSPPPPPPQPRQSRLLYLRDSSGGGGDGSGTPSFSVAG
ncbi:hypothetical protein E2C01_098829 [Portunus trituberculatus]|uniref:Uncharacterized protein n=1 Tax=Portunus trituberculatus TaxID=210409 RepID=A0A5B7K982_PORTR|nr:hypothetical protein [Portunus trituberculatus]